MFHFKFFSFFLFICLPIAVDSLTNVEAFSLPPRLNSIGILSTNVQFIFRLLHFVSLLAIIDLLVFLLGILLFFFFKPNLFLLFLKLIDCSLIALLNCILFLQSLVISRFNKFNVFQLDKRAQLHTISFIRSAHILQL